MPGARITTLTAVHESPPVHFVGNFLSSEEAYELIELAAPELKLSVVGNARAVEQRSAKERRSSTNAKLNLSVPLVRTVAKRAATLLGVQVISYFLVLCPLCEKYGTFIERCNALIEKVSHVQEKL
eukprot:SAG31_NODE_18241_length_642_cov_1.316759_2_plen_125_part_01